METIAFLEQMALSTHFDPNAQALLDAISSELKHNFLAQNSQAIKKMFSNSLMFPNEVDVLLIEQK